MARSILKASQWKLLLQCIATGQVGNDLLYKTVEAWVYNRPFPEETIALVGEPYDVAEPQRMVVPKSQPLM